MDTGYQHGSDMLVGIVSGDKFSPLGHSKTCTITNSAETKERAVKPTLREKKEAANPGMWKEKSVSSLAVSISAEGFKFYGDEMGYDKLLEMWETGEAVKVRYALRGEEKTKYREGDFIIMSLEEQNPGDDDASYTISLENSGQVEAKTVSNS